MESKYPKNPIIENNLKVFNEKLVIIYRNILRKSTENLCKEQYQNLSKYAILNEDGFFPKSDAQENLLSENFENFMNCFNNDNIQIISLIKNLDLDFINNNNELSGCVERASLNSTIKSNAEIEIGIYNCYKKFEENYLKILNDYDNNISKYMI